MGIDSIHSIEVNYKPVEIGPHGFKQAIIRRKGTKDIIHDTCKSVVLMFNPVTFGGVQEEVTKSYEDAPKTIKVVFEALSKSILCETEYIRVYNATTECSDFRIKVFMKTESVDNFPKDDPLSPKECIAPWWIAWGSESDFDGSNHVKISHENLLNNRWKTCIEGLSENNTIATGFQTENGIFVLIEPTEKKKITDSSVKGKYLHPLRLAPPRFGNDPKEVADNKNLIKAQIGGIQAK